MRGTGSFQIKVFGVCFSYLSEWAPTPNRENLRCSSRRDGRLTLEHNDTISEVSSHNEIVLNDESSLF